MKARGFTLIELMVAVLITAIIAVMGYTALNQAATNRSQVEAQAARVLEVQRGLRTLAQDIELMAPRPVRDPLGNGVQPALVVGTATSAVGTSGRSGSGMANNIRAAGTANSPGGTSTASTLSNLALQPLAIISLTRGSWANLAGLQRTEEQRVSYLLENGALVRYHLPVLDAAGEIPAVRRELIHDVESIALRYMDAGHAWQSSWQLGLTSGNGRQPTMRERPVAVEVTLKLRDWGTITRIFEVAG
jgi:general secretion pathway protein J